MPRNAKPPKSVPRPVDVAALRGRLRLSQAQFARDFGLDVATVQAWEQDRRRPDRAAQVLLVVIEREPNAVSRALKRRPKAGGRPSDYDDGPLLANMAEMLAWRQDRIVQKRELEKAARDAIADVIGYEDWLPDKVERALGRLKKKWAKKGAELVASVRQRTGYLARPLYPPSLASRPPDPEKVALISEARSLVTGLRSVSQWAAECADLVEQQSDEGTLHPDLRKHARALIALVRREQEQPRPGKG